MEGSGLEFYLYTYFYIGVALLGLFGSIQKSCRQDIRNSTRMIGKKMAKSRLERKEQD